MGHAAAGLPPSLWPPVALRRASVGPPAAAAPLPGHSALGPAQAAPRPAAAGLWGREVLEPRSRHASHAHSICS
jgi:hypothetical protein